MSTTTLKRSMKRLTEAAIEGGWIVEPTFDGDVVRIEMHSPPEVDLDAAHLAERRFLAVTNIVVSGAADTGAWFGVEATDVNGNRPGPLGLGTVGDVERLLGARKRHLASLTAAAERTTRERLVAAERAAVREAYVEGLADDYRYRAIVTIAESTETPMEIDTTDGRSLYWVSSAVTNHLTAVLRKRMAIRALDIVGWPVGSGGFVVDRPGDVGTPITLGEALARAVTEVLGHETSTSAPFEALAMAAKDVLRYA